MSRVNARRSGRKLFRSVTGNDVVSATMTRPKQGFFLVLVLIVISVATMACYSFTELMLVYDDSAHLSGNIVQARANVESGSEMIRLVLSQSREERANNGGVFSNPELFQAVSVSLGTYGLSPSNFSVIMPSLDEMGRYSGIRFGLQNESAKLNLNALMVLEENGDGLSALLSGLSGDEDQAEASIAMLFLMALPEMTQDVAEAILDWLDEDTEPRMYGAELEYYGNLTSPYSPQNGPIQSVEDLLLVKGVTPLLLFGADANRNGVLDADEQQRFGVTIETPGALGWASYLTVYGAEANKRENGEPRINVNNEDLELLMEQLSEAGFDESFATFIVAYRVFSQQDGGGADSDTVNDALGITPGGGGGNAGGGGNNGGGGGNAGGGGNNGGGGNAGGGTQAQTWDPKVLEDQDLSGGGSVSINQVLDLIGAEITVADPNTGAETTYKSPFLPITENPILMTIYMPLLMDALTTQDSPVMPGRLNINECPAELLYGLPILTTEQVDAIIEGRSNQSDNENHRFGTWPMVEGLITMEQMKQLTPLVTGGGDVFRAQIIGYYEQTGIYHRADIIIDATSANPKIVSLKDLSHLGRGFDLSTLGVQSVSGIGF